MSPFKEQNPSSSIGITMTAIYTFHIVSAADLVDTLIINSFAQGQHSTKRKTLLSNAVFATPAFCSAIGLAK